MALKEYNYNGSTYQFDDSDVPKGAVLVETKAATQPANKSRSATTKTGKTAGEKPPAKTDPEQPENPAHATPPATGSAD